MEKIEMEFENDLTGEKVWGEVVYDENEEFGGHSSWEEVVMMFGGWYMKPAGEEGKRDLWAGRNKWLVEHSYRKEEADERPMA